MNEWTAIIEHLHHSLSSASRPLYSPFLSTILTHLTTGEKEQGELWKTFKESDARSNDAFSTVDSEVNGLDNSGAIIALTTTIITFMPSITLSTINAISNSNIKKMVETR